MATRRIAGRHAPVARAKSLYLLSFRMGFSPRGIRSFLRASAPAPTVQCLSHAPQWPDENFQLACEVQKRRTLRKRDSSGRCYRVRLDFRFCVLQRPLLMMDFSTAQPPLPHGVQAVALGQPVLQAVLVPQLNRPDGAIASAKFRSRPATLGIVGDPSASANMRAWKYGRR